MSITLELPPDVEASIRERAAARGLEPADYLRDLALRDTGDEATDAEMAEEEREGVERGLADFAAGRYRPFSEFAAEMRARHDLSD